MIGHATAEWASAAIGVDEGPDGPIVVRAVRRFGRVTTEQADRVCPGAAACVCGLSERESTARRVSVPLASAAKALKVLPSLLDVQLPRGLAGSVHVCAGLRSDAPGWAMTVAIADEEELRARLERAAAAGFDPHVADQESLALWSQALTECPPANMDQTRGVLYLGADRVTAVLGRGPELLSAHGLKRFDADAVKRLARSVFGDAPDTVHWIWCGPLAADPDRLAEARRALGTDGARDQVLADPRLALARAYAWRALTPGPLRCDFRTGSFAHPEVARRRQSSRRLAILSILAAGLAAWAGALYAGRLFEEARRAAGREVASLAAGLIGDLDQEATLWPGYEARTAESVFREAEPLYAPILRADAAPRGPGLGHWLMQVREAGATVHRLEWTETIFRVQGTAPDAESVATLARQAERETGFKLTARTGRRLAHGLEFWLEQAQP